MKYFIAIIITLYGSNTAQCEDSVRYLKVHFLYGSKPKFKFRKTEEKWFGGKLGGHVGLEIEKGKIFSFLPANELHLIEKKKNKSSYFAEHDSGAFYSIFGPDLDSVRMAIFYIPITQSQQEKLDSIRSSYLHTTPYDYAFIGMRCGASTYEILAQLGILKPYRPRRTFMKIFYPRRLRKRLFKLAVEQRWKITQTDGVQTRNWEND